MIEGEQMAKQALRDATAFKLTTAAELNRQEALSSLPSLALPRLNLFFPRGLKRGSLIEITGQKSSGRTSASLYILAEAITKGETCACIDLCNQFDPTSLANTGVTLDQFSWVRCQGNTVHAMRSTDLLLHAGGFGVVLLDLSGATPQALNRIPLSYWFRFRQIIEDTPTILLVCGDQPQARSCSTNSLQIQSKKFHWLGDGAYSLLSSLESSGVTAKTAAVKVTSIRPESLLIPAPIV